MVQDAQLVTTSDFENVASSHFLDGQLVSYTHRSPEKETANEDSFAILPFDEQSGVLLVADGLGGKPRGADASALAIKSVAHSLAQAREQGLSLRDGILNGFEAANRAILESGSGCATTMIVIEMRGSSVRPYHVGDSMAMIIGQRGKIKLQTLAHAPVAYMVESGMLDENEALHHEDRNIVSNVVGTADMRIEVGAEIELASLDTLVIGSDGLFDNFYIDEIVQRTRKGGLTQAASDLVSACQTRMTQPELGKPCHPDDTTLLLYRRGKM